MTIKDKLKLWLTNVLAVILVIGVLAAIVSGLLYAAVRSHDKRWADEKVCFKELTRIVEASPREKS